MSQAGAGSRSGQRRGGGPPPPHGAPRGRGRGDSWAARARQTPVRILQRHEPFERESYEVEAGAKGTQLDIAALLRRQQEKKRQQQQQQQQQQLQQQQQRPKKPQGQQRQPRAVSDSAVVPQKTGKLSLLRRKKNITRKPTKLKQRILHSRLEDWVRETIVMPMVSRASASQEGEREEGQTSSRTRSWRPPQQRRQRRRRRRPRAVLEMEREFFPHLEPPKPLRPYQKQFVTPSLSDEVRTLLEKLVVFQKRQVEKNPAMARVRQRYVMGIKEVQNMLSIDRVRLVVIATNIERDLHEWVGELIAQAAAERVPVVFALKRRDIGIVLGLPRRKISIVGVLDYSGAEDAAKSAIEQARVLREEFLMRSEDTLLDEANDANWHSDSDDEGETHSTLNPEAASFQPSFYGAAVYDPASSSYFPSDVHDNRTYFGFMY